MISRIPNAIYIVLALGAAFGLFFLHFSKPLPSDWQNGGTLFIHGRQSIRLSFANTPQLREQGLSNTQNLPTDTGLFFVFDAPETTGFWMKDMQYPIDIVWINEKKRVIDIDDHVTPESYPTVYYPSEPVQYVLEISADQAKTLGLTIGTKIDFAVNY